MEADILFCPILGRIEVTPGEEYTYEQCVKRKCAWWNSFKAADGTWEGNCAVLDLTRALETGLGVYNLR